MPERSVSKKYSLFVNTMIFLFPIVIGTIKVAGDLILFFLALAGIFIAISYKVSPFSVKEIKLFSWLMLSYFLVVVLSILLSGKALELMHYSSRELYFLFAPFVALAIIKAEADLAFLWIGIRVALILLGVIAYYGVFIDVPRYSGVMHPNVFGDISVIMTLFILIHLSLNRHIRAENMLSVIAIFFGFSAIILSQDRMAWLVLIIFSPFYLALLFKLKVHLKKYILILIMLLCASIFVSTLIQDKVYTKLVDRAALSVQEVTNWADGTKRVSSVGTRLTMWEGSLKALPDMPWSGFGYRNSINEVSKYFSKYEKSVILRYNHLHNIYIEHLISRGVLGILSILALLSIPLFVFISRLKDMEANLVGVVLISSFAILGMTHAVFGVVFMSAFFVFFLSIFLPLSIKNK
jgi:O-antigen ligase